MVSFDILPSEILSNIADNLHVADLKSLLQTSNRVNAVLKDALLSKVKLRYHTSRTSDYVPVGMVDRTRLCRVQDPHNFALRMVNDKELAKSVQTLVIDSVCSCFNAASASQPPAPCCFLNHTFFDNLVGLKTLVFEIDSKAQIVSPLSILAMGTIPVIQRLEVLGLSSYVRRTAIPLHLHFPVYHFVSGSIKHLHLYQQRLDDPQAAHFGSQPAMRLQTIIIDDCIIPANALEFLLRSAPNVQNLSFTKGCTSASRPTANFADLGNSLMALQNLKTLRVISHVDEDGTILGPRTIMSSVKELVISPTVLIGRSACAPKFYGTRITSDAQVLRFAQVLPTGLEQVKLVIELDQTYRIKDYTKHLAQSIYDERTRLRDLRVVIFVENPNCREVRCSHRLDEHYFPQRSNQKTGIVSVPTKYRHGEPWRKCRKAGIRVDLTRVFQSHCTWASEV